jgi:hypothetical protein
MFLLLYCLQRDPRQRHGGPPIDGSYSPHGISPHQSQQQAVLPQQNDIMATLQSMMGTATQENTNSADPTTQILLQVRFRSDKALDCSETDADV